MPDSLKRLSLVVLCVMVLPAAATAADVTVTFSGQAQLDAAGLGSSSFSGSLTWDTTASPTFCGTSFCTWNLKAATLVVNGVTYLPSVTPFDQSTVSVVNDWTGGFPVGFLGSDGLFINLRFPPPNELFGTYHAVQLQLAGPSAMFASTALPTDLGFLSVVTATSAEFDFDGEPDDPGTVTFGGQSTFDSLIGLVQSFDLAHGITTSLDAKLLAARNALSAARNGNLAAACGQLTAFVNEVNAQAGLTPAQANQLMSIATQLQTLLGCK